MLLFVRAHEELAILFRLGKEWMVENALRVCVYVYICVCVCVCVCLCEWWGRMGCGMDSIEPDWGRSGSIELSHHKQVLLDPWVPVFKKNSVDDDDGGGDGGGGGGGGVCEVFRLCLVVMEHGWDWY